MSKRSVMWSVLLMLAAVVLVGVPVNAQEVAAEIGGESVTLPAWSMWAVVVMIAAVLGFASWVEHTKNQQVREAMATVNFAMQQLAASMPAVVKQPAQALVAGGVASGFDYLEQNVTSRTPGELDDQLLDEAEERTKKLLRKWGVMPPEEESPAASE